jgi:hypothetical protein
MARARGDLSVAVRVFLAVLVSGVAQWEEEVTMEGLGKCGWLVGRWGRVTVVGF